MDPVDLSIEPIDVPPRLLLLHFRHDVLLLNDLAGGLTTPIKELLYKGVSRNDLAHVEKPRLDFLLSFDNVLAR